MLNIKGVNYERFLIDCTHVQKLWTQFISSVEVSSDSVSDNCQNRSSCSAKIFMKNMQHSIFFPFYCKIHIQVAASIFPVVIHPVARIHIAYANIYLKHVYLYVCVLVCFMQSIGYMISLKNIYFHSILFTKIKKENRSKFHTAAYTNVYLLLPTSILTWSLGLIKRGASNL